METEQPMATFNRRQPRLSMLTIHPLPDRSGLVLAGEADLTVKETLRAALAALPADGAGEINLDLAALRFIDLACTRELIALTARHPAARIIIRHPPAALLRITALAYPGAALEFTGTPGPHGPPAGQDRDTASTPDRSPPPGPAPPGTRSAPRQHQHDSKTQRPAAAANLRIHVRTVA